MKTLALLLATFSIAGTDPVPNPHEATLEQLIRKWPLQLLKLDQKKTDAVQITAYETPGVKHGVALGQIMRINAPLARVKAVLEDYSSFKDLYFTFKDVRVLEKTKAGVLVEWEQSVPLPFVPNTIYQTLIESQKKGKTQLYRFRLKRSDTLKYLDTVIFLDPEGENATLYTEWDFFDAEWGVAATVAPERIWTDSIRDIYYSDIVAKLKAENPDWTYSKIKAAAKESFKAYGDVSIKESKKRFELPK